MQSIKEYITLSWAGNLMRICKRKLGCEQRHQWTTSTLYKVRESTDGKCFYCRIQLAMDSRSLGSPEKRMEIDHYWPYSKGGANLLPNLVPACRRCNRAKSSQRASVFVRKHRTYTKPFCRKFHEGKYCTQQPRDGNKYCFRHGVLHICDHS